MQGTITRNLEVQLTIHLLVNCLGYAVQMMVRTIHVMQSLLLKQLHVHLMTASTEAGACVRLIELELHSVHV